jgi:hypothetical protein
MNRADEYRAAPTTSQDRSNVIPLLRRDVAELRMNTIWRLISTGQLGVIQIGRRTLVTMTSLESLVATLASTRREPRKVGKKSSDGCPI